MTAAKITPIHSAAVTAIVDLLSAGRLMALGVNRPDGWPQVTTVGYINEGLDLYFVVARDSQKLANLQADPRVSVAIRREAGHGDAVGVSMAGHAIEVTDPVTISRINTLAWERYPDFHIYGPGSDFVAVIHLTPQVVSPVSITDGRSHAETFSLGAATTDPHAPLPVTALI
jgi:general stress protein 26